MRFFQISVMEAFMGKWKLDYSACEGYNEFMSAEVNKMIVTDMMMMMMVIRMMMMMMMMATESLQMQRLTMIFIRNVFYQNKAFSSLTPGFPAIFDNLHFGKIQIAFLFHPGNSTGRPGKDEGPRLYHHLLKGKSHTGLPPEQTYITC